MMLLPESFFRNFMLYVVQEKDFLVSKNTYMLYKKAYAYVEQEKYFEQKQAYFCISTAKHKSLVEPELWDKVLSSFPLGQRLVALFSLGAKQASLPGKVHGVIIDSRGNLHLFFKRSLKKKPSYHDIQALMHHPQSLCLPKGGDPLHAFEAYFKDYPMMQTKDLVREIEKLRPSDAYAFYDHPLQADTQEDGLFAAMGHDKEEGEIEALPDEEKDKIIHRQSNVALKTRMHEHSVFDVEEDLLSDEHLRESVLNNSETYAQGESQDEQEMTQSLAKDARFSREGRKSGANN